MTAPPALPRQPAGTLDAARVAGLRELGAQEFANLVRLFLGHTASLVAQLATAAASADTPALDRLAHSLIGSSDTFGAHVLAEMCRDLRAAIGAPKGRSVAYLVADIEIEFVAVGQSLRAEIGDVTPPVR